MAIGTVESKGLFLGTTAVENLFVSGTITTSGSMQLGQSLIDSDSHLVLSSSVGSMVVVSGNLDVLGLFTVNHSPVSSPVTGSNNFFVQNILDVSGTIRNPVGHLILSSSVGSVVAVSGALRSVNLSAAFDLLTNPNESLSLIKVGQSSSLSGTIATVTTTTAQSGWTTNYPWQKKVFYIGTKYWLFYADGTSQVYSTSNDGITWSAAIIVRAGTGLGHRIAYWYDGTYIHYSYSDAEDGGDLFYRRGTPNSDGTITWSAAEQTVLSVALGDTVGYPTVIADSSGIPLIGCVRFKAPGFSFPASGSVFKATTSDGTWTTATGFPYTLTIHSSVYPVPVGIPLSGSKTFWFYSNDSATHQDTAYGRLHTGSGWAPEERVSVSNTPATNFDAIVDDNDTIHFVFQATGSVPDKIPRYRRRDGIRGWGNEVSLTSSAASADFIPTLSKVKREQVVAFWQHENKIYQRIIEDGGVLRDSEKILVDESTDTIPNKISLNTTLKANKPLLAYPTKAASPFNVRVALTTPTTNFGTILLDGNAVVRGVLSNDRDDLILSSSGGRVTVSGTLNIPEKIISTAQHLILSSSAGSQVAVSGSTRILTGLEVGPFGSDSGQGSGRVNVAGIVGEYGLVSRALTSAAQITNPGDRWVMYNNGGTFSYWTTITGNVLTLSPTGSITATSGHLILSSSAGSEIVASGTLVGAAGLIVARTIGGNPTVRIDADGNQYPLITGRSGGGTLSAPLAASNGTGLLSNLGQGYNGTSYVSAVSIDYAATETWSGTAKGGQMNFATTQNGTTNYAYKWSINHHGHLVAYTDNSFDIGSGSTNRPRDIYLAGKFVNTNQHLILSSSNGSKVTVSGNLEVRQTLTVNGVEVGGASTDTAAFANFRGHVSGSSGINHYVPLCMPYVGVSMTAQSNTVNLLRAWPYIAPARGGTLGKVAFRTTTSNAGAVLRLGIYSNTSATNIYPSTLLYDSGQIDTSTAGTFQVLPNLALTGGKLYWFALLAGTAATSVVAVGVSNIVQGLFLSNAPETDESRTQYIVDFTYAALPSNFPASAVLQQIDMPHFRGAFSA